jgi:hypothetical protein
MAAAVAGMAMPKAHSFRGDATVKDLAAAVLGTEQAGDNKVMAMLVLEGGRDFVHGESSGSLGTDVGQHNGNWHNSNVGFQRGGNFNGNNNHFGY